MTYEELLELTDAGVEIWKPIPDYDGYFEISNLGRVKSVERWVKQGNFTRHVTEKIKKAHITPYGYPAVTLCKEGKSKETQLHILLARTFIPNPDQKTQIDHINTVKTDFRLKNLRWVTPKENANNELTLAHCRENTYSEEALRKRLETRKIRGTSTAPKTVYQYTKSGEFVKEYYSSHEAEKETGIHNAAIRRVLDDNTQAAGNFLWFSTPTDAPKYVRRMPKTSKVLLQYDVDGNFIKEWPSIHEAARALGLHLANITRSMRKAKNPKRYRFEFKEGNI